MRRRILVSRANMSMALAGVDLFAAIVFCGMSAGNTYPRLFLLALSIACLLLAHAFVGFYRSWRRGWDTINLLATLGFLPALCLAAIAVTAISEIVKS